MSDFVPPGDGYAASARCAVHADQSAQAICARCGNFMCPACSENGQYDACPSCRALTGEVPGFVWNRESFSLDALWSFCWGHFTRDWVMLSLSALVFFVVIIGTTFIGNILQAAGKAIHPAAYGGMAVVGQFIQSVVQTTLTGGLCVVLYGVFKGGTADVGKLFGQFSNLATYALITVIEFAVVIVPIMVFGGIAGAVYFATNQNTDVTIGVSVLLALVAVVPLIWVLLPFDLAAIEVALGGETNGTQAVKNAFALAKGKRLWMFLFAMVAGLVSLVGVFVCCVGVLPAMALGQMLKLTLFLAIRNGSGLPPMRGQLN